MLVEERDRAKEVVCLLCKTPFRIDAESAPLTREMKKGSEESTE